LESGGVKYGLTCSKACSLLNHAKPTQTIEVTRLVNDFHCFKFIVTSNCKEHYGPVKTMSLVAHELRAKELVDSRCLCSPSTSQSISSHANHANIWHHLWSQVPTCWINLAIS
jgi:hypothetical protein